MYAALTRSEISRSGPVMNRVSNIPKTYISVIHKTFHGEMEMQKNFKSEESIFSCIFLLLGKGGFYIIFETYQKYF